MVMGLSMRSQLSEANPFKTGQAPAVRPPVLTPQLTHDTRTQPVDRPKDERSGYDNSNARLLTDSDTVKGFNQILEHTGAHKVEENIGGVKAFFTSLLPDKGTLLGKGDLSSEIVSAKSLSGGYAANTVGSLENIHPLGLTSPSDEKLINPGTTGNHNPVGGTFGFVTSVIGLWNAKNQIDDGEKKEAAVGRINKKIEALDGIHTTIKDLLDPAKGGAFDGNKQKLTAELNKIKASLESERNSANGDLRNYLDAQILDIQAKIDAVAPLNHTDPCPALTAFSNQIQSDAKAMKALTIILSDEASSDKFWGKFGATTSANGLLNSIVTLASIGTKTGDVTQASSVGDGVLTWLGNTFSNVLIVTQGISAVGMCISGTYNAVKDSMDAHRSTKRIERVDKFLENRPARGPANSAQAQKQEEVKDIAKMVKAENITNKRWKIFSAIKNAFTAIAGALLAIGVFAAAAFVAVTPVGWAIGAAAAVAGIGFGIYKLYQKYQHSKTVEALEGQKGNAQTRLTEVLGAQSKTEITQERDDLAALKTTLTGHRKNQSLLTERQSLLDKQRALTDNLRLAEKKALLSTRQELEQKHEILNARSSLKDRLSQLPGNRELIVQLQENTRKLQQFYPDGISDEPGYLGAEIGHVASLLVQNRIDLVPFNYSGNTTADLGVVTGQIRQNELRGGGETLLHLTEILQQNKDQLTAGGIVSDNIGVELANITASMTAIHTQLGNPPFSIEALPVVADLKPGDLDTKLGELNTKVDQIQQLEQLVADIDIRLRQTSPTHAIQDLVRLVREDNPDAMDFALYVLQTPPPSPELADALKSEPPDQITIDRLKPVWQAQVALTNPALLAELFRKNMGLAFG